MEDTIASAEGKLSGMTAPDRVARIQQQWREQRPDLDVSPQGVIGRLHRVGDLLREQLIAVYRQHGLGEGEFDVLAALRRAGAPYELAPGEIARHTMVTTGAVSKRLDRLEAAGLVVRHGNDGDGRGRVVALTDAGRRTIDEAFTAHIRNEQRLLAALSPDDRDRLEAILTTWLADLER
jgi:DNA-binding MarR family transcriptional regulator